MHSTGTVVLVLVCRVLDIRLVSSMFIGKHRRVVVMLQRPLEKPDGLDVSDQSKVHPQPVSYTHLTLPTILRV